MDSLKRPFGIPGWPLGVVEATDGVVNKACFFVFLWTLPPKEAGMYSGIWRTGRLPFLLLEAGFEAVMVISGSKWGGDEAKLSVGFPEKTEIYSFWRSKKKSVFQSRLLHFTQNLLLLRVLRFSINYWTEKKVIATGTLFFVKLHTVMDRRWHGSRTPAAWNRNRKHWNDGWLLFDRGRGLLWTDDGRYADLWPG